MAISRSVPHIPISRVRTSSEPSDAGGSGRSITPAVSGRPGTIAIALNALARPDRLGALQGRRTVPGRLLALAQLLVDTDQMHHGVDQRQMREGLGEVAEVQAAGGIELLGVQLQRAGVGQQLRAQCSRAVDLSDL